MGHPCSARSISLSLEFFNSFSLFLDSKSRHFINRYEKVQLDFFR